MKLAKKILYISLWSLIIVGIIVMLGFVGKEHKKLPCKKINISINRNGDNYFVEEEDILEMIRQKGASLVGQALEKIDVRQLEKTIESHPAIENAEVYETIDGELEIKVKQRRPIVRIMPWGKEGYYIDNEGKPMPLSTKYTARVMVVNGDIYESYNNYALLKLNSKDINDSLLKKTSLDNIYMLAKYIEESEFWRAQVEQIYIKEEQAELIPKIGNHRIILGNISNLDTAAIAERFNKLMTFYTKGLNKIGWNQYETINLDYKNQVICTRKKENISQEQN